MAWTYKHLDQQDRILSQTGLDTQDQSTGSKKKKWRWGHWTSSSQRQKLDPGSSLCTAGNQNVSKAQI